MSEEPRIRSQKLHCQCCVYLDALFKKLSKVAEIAYTSSNPQEGSTPWNFCISIGNLKMAVPWLSLLIGLRHNRYVHKYQS